MIARPHNDHECLDAATEELMRQVEARNPALVALAEAHDSPEALFATIRTWPQDDDRGDPCEEPKITTCRPPQRFQLDNPRPNCFERTATAIGAAQMRWPEHVYRMATTDTPNGLHTFPTMDGEPVVLDPVQSRNALRAGLFHNRRARNAGDPGNDVEVRRLRLQRLIGTDETKGVRGDLGRARKAKAAGYTTWVDGKPIDDAIATYERALATYQERLDALDQEGATRNACGAAPRPIAITPTEAIDWIASLAMEPAVRFKDGARRVQCGHRAMRGVLVLRPIVVADVRHVAFVLALAEREARLFGPVGLRIVHSTARAVDKLDRMAADRWLAARAGGAATGSRNAGPFELHIGGTTIAPNIPLLSSLARVGGRIAGNIGLEALKVQLASMGISPPILNTVEQELNREGLTLGPLATPPPMLGTFGALTPEALAGRWLAGKL